MNDDGNVEDNEEFVIELFLKSPMLRMLNYRCQRATVMTLAW